MESQDQANMYKTGQGSDRDGVSVRTISYERLKSRDTNQVEARNLLEACKKDGSFYLDLRGEQAERLLDTLKWLVTKAEQFHDLPIPQKTESAG